MINSLDTRGLGDSSRPLNGYDSQTRAADIAALLAHPDLAISRKYHLLGHDWGGPVAFALALTEKEHLLSLTIVDVTIPGLAVDISQGGKRWHHAIHLTPDLPEVLTNGREKEYLGWFYREFSANPAAFTESDEEEFLRTYRKPGAMSAGFSYYRNIPNDRLVLIGWFESLGEILTIFFRSDYCASATKGVTLGFPILAIGGGRTESRGRAGEVAQSLAGLGKIEERICETAGHFVPEDDPEWFNAEVLAFFTRVDGKK